MRCLSCKYSLENLTARGEGGHRCPECGRAFDPEDVNTFDFGQAVIERRLKRATLTWTISGASLWIILSLIFILTILRLVLPSS